MEIRTSENIDKLSQAMLQAQIQISNAELDSSNPHFRSRYASLLAVLEACKKPLNDSGIYFIQAPVALDCKDCLGLVTRLTHAESGHWLEATMSMPLQKVDPQGMGSAITYARRYSLMALLGMAAEDDDAEAAMSRPAAQAPQRQAPQRQAPQWQAPANPAPPATGASGLPKLNGISYQEGLIDGSPAMIAKGNTFPHKDALKQSGFRFDQNSKDWFLPIPDGAEGGMEPAMEEVPW